MLPARLRYAFLLVLCLTCAACGKDSISRVPGALEPVTLLSSSVNIPPGGSAGIAFRCAGYSSSSTVQLRTRDGGEPRFFRLSEVGEGDSHGTYVAGVTDSGTAAAYSVEACLVIDGVPSAFICINCGEPVFPPAPQTGLPVVYIDIEGGLPVDSKSVERQAVLKVRGAGGYGSQAPASCSIRGRGNTSWNWPKKPYRIEFRDRVSMLGMPSHGHWVLLAGFPDRTMMRNLVAAKVSSLTSLDWTPRCVPVELVLNGSHVGNYLLSEQVEADACRVDVAPDGLLLELDFHYDNEVQWIDPHGLSMLGAGVPFAVRYPSPSAMDDGEREGIRRYVSEVAETVYSSAFTDPRDGYARWLDVPSFIDYWLVYAVLGNPEIINPSSVFFHRKGQGKLSAGPCWDFDWCLTQTGISVEELSGPVGREAIWYMRLFEDPAFAAMVRERFVELKPALLTVDDYIAECETLLQASAELNFTLWNPADDRWQNKGLLVNGDENLSFTDAVARLRSVYLRRLQLLEDNL